MKIIETYVIDSHLGRNLLYSIKLLSGDNYREDEGFTYKCNPDDKYLTNCFIDTTKGVINFLGINESSALRGLDYYSTKMQELNIQLENDEISLEQYRILREHIDNHIWIIQRKLETNLMD